MGCGDQEVEVDATACRGGATADCSRRQVRRRPRLQQASGTAMADDCRWWGCCGGWRLRRPRVWRQRATPGGGGGSRDRQERKKILVEVRPFGRTNAPIVSRCAGLHLAHLASFIRNQCDGKNNFHSLGSATRVALGPHLLLRLRPIPRAEPVSQLRVYHGLGFKYITGHTVA